MSEFKPDYLCNKSDCKGRDTYEDVIQELREELHAAYQCIIDATRAFAPPTDGKDVSKWFDDHKETIDAVLEWKRNG